MKHLYFIQTTKGIWVPGGLYEDKGDAIEAARAINVEKERLVRLDFQSEAKWVHPKHRQETAVSA